ncbi:MAG: tRNA epoxyqueuosine(34) reductase QueG [Schleiferiaceae bacterium]
MTRTEATQFLKREALRLGFMEARVARADFLADEAPRLEEWLARGLHGSMGYMANHFDKRLDPRLLVPGARSVVSLAFNYYPEPSELEADGRPRVARYAYGEDYHRVVKDRLFELLDALRSAVGAIDGRCFVDSAPVMERAWAERSGLGWVGKNSLVLRKNAGSYFFLAELVVDYDFVPDLPVADHCGTCTRCLDACPTQAIIAPQVVDSARCISHATIELHGALPREMAESLHPWVFGCDICQEVCPWNRHATPHEEPRFAPGNWVSWSISDWLYASETALKRPLAVPPLHVPV